jgi:hypothetical protein
MIMKWLAVAALSVSVACALWINFGIRMPVESQDRTVGLLVDYDELRRLADGNQDVSFADIARKASKAGATGIVVRERILAEWESAGDILVLTGGQFAFYTGLVPGDSLPASLVAEAGGLVAETSGLVIEAGGTYILTKDTQVYEQIFAQLDGKKRYPEPFEYNGYMGIATRLHSSERATLGLGFPLRQLEEAAAEGLQVIARIRNWEPVREDSLAEVSRWLSMIPNLAGVGFNDMSVPGGGTSPILQDRLAEALLPLDKPLISFEFYDQAGLSGLAGRMGNQVLRAHAIAENELRKYANIQDAIDRYNLAATERNVRYVYLRFYGMENPAASMLSNIDLITVIRDGLSGEGLRVGNPEPIPSFTIPQFLQFLLGLGVIAAGGWLCALAAAPFAEKKYLLPYGILLVLCGLAWAFLLYRTPILARKLFALAGAVVFPSLGIMLELAQCPGAAGEDGARQVIRAAAMKLRLRVLLSAVRSLLVMSMFTLAGAMVMSALLVEPAFMLKLDGFVGVKLAHVVPLVLVPCILWLKEKEWFGILRDTATNPVKLWQLAAGVVVLAGLAIYILRTGNDSLGTVTNLEMSIRQYLDRFLVVRPRTKEFLIGHPLMLVLLYFGYKFEMFPVLLIGIIGQVSLINTYAHIHTPVTISLLRSVHGLWIGILLGAVAVAMLLWIFRMAASMSARYRERGEGHDLS